MIAALGWYTSLSATYYSSRTRYIAGDGRRVREPSLGKQCMPISSRPIGRFPGTTISGPSPRMTGSWTTTRREIPVGCLVLFGVCDALCRKAVDWLEVFGFWRTRHRASGVNRSPSAIRRESFERSRIEHTHVVGGMEATAYTIQREPRAERQRICLQARARVDDTTVGFTQSAAARLCWEHTTLAPRSPAPDTSALSRLLPNRKAYLAS